MIANIDIKPAFASPQAALRFTAIILAFLLLPLALFFSGLSKPEDPYCEVPSKAGPFGYFKQEIFDNKGDIDILFLGSSISWNAIDARTIQDTLTRSKGMPTTVINFGSNWRNEDVYYKLFKDLSAHRRIKLLVFHMPTASQRANEPHAKAHFWHVFGDDPSSLTGLSVTRRIQEYMLNVLGAPRHLLGLIRGNICYDLRNASERNGTLLSKVGYRGEPFIETQLPPPSFTAEQLIYSTKTKSNFEFLHRGLGDYQNHYIRKMLDLAVDRGVPVALVSVPLYSQRQLDKVQEREYWPDYFRRPIAMLGVPNRELFSGLSEDQIKDLYYDDHLNINGTRYYTNAILPGVLELYQRAVNEGLKPEGAD